MNRLPQFGLAVVIAVAATIAVAISGDFPGAVRIAAGSGHFVAGVQLDPGNNGNFELFTGRVGDQPIHPLGRFNGRLADVAIGDDGNPFALTRDGALDRHDNNPDTVALPDSRWNMQAMTLHNNLPLAVTLDGNHLYLVRTGAGQSWRQDEDPVASTVPPSRTEIHSLADGALHLLWITRPENLAGGALRHLIQKDGVWSESDPLMLGNIVGFCSYPDADGLRIFALVADPIGDGPERIIARIYHDGSWHAAAVPPGIERVLTNHPFSFAAAQSPANETLWIASSPDGAGLTRIRPDGSVTTTTLAPAPESLELGIAPRFTSLITLGLFCVLLLVYCRRSRTLSRLQPERAPDLLSRGAALGIDWMLASLAMTAYHAASGDIRILADLILQGKVETFFWVNLGGLALLMLISESAFGTTPGKALAGLRVASIFGGKPHILQAFIRNFMRIVDMYPISGALPGIIGAVSTFTNRGRQRIGDMVAGTCVRRHLPLDKRGILLASASPRRLELIKELGVPVRVEIPNIDEDSIKGDYPEDTVRLLAEAKAKTAMEHARPPEVVVAADTIVVLDGAILGKPADAAEADSMLHRLSGRSHSVFTGITVYDTATGRGVSAVEQTEVEFRPLSDHEIAAYVATGDPLDKAGAYGIQTANLVKQTRGSLSNVAGLPLEKLQSLINILTL